MNGLQIHRNFGLQELLDEGIITPKDFRREMSRPTGGVDRSSTVRLRKRHRPTAKVAVAVESTDSRGFGFYGERIVVELRVPRRQIRKFIGSKNCRWTDCDDRCDFEDERRNREKADRLALQQELREFRDELETIRYDEAQTWAEYKAEEEARQDYEDWLDEKKALAELREEMREDLRRALMDDLDRETEEDLAAQAGIDDYDDEPEAQDEDRHGPF